MNTQRTEAQIEASRANGKLSRGPVTEEGKAIAAANGVRHGLLSNQPLLPGEEKERFDRILANALVTYEPANPSELELVEELAMHKWHQLRIWGMELAGHAGEILTQTEEPPDLADTDMSWRAYLAFKNMHQDRRCMELMHRYATSHGNQHNRIRKELLALKKERDKVLGEK